MGLSDTPASLNWCLERCKFKFEQTDNNVVSWTEDDNNGTKLSVIYYNTADETCPDVVKARVFHEAACAIRCIHASELQKLQKSGETETSGLCNVTTENATRRYKVGERAGYLAEHEYFGGVILLLHDSGTLHNRDGEEIHLPVYAKIREVSYDRPSFSRKMECQLWSGNAWTDLGTYYYKEGRVACGGVERTGGVRQGTYMSRDP